MSTNNYFYLCSKELLNQIINFSDNIRTNQLFNIQTNIDPSWTIISTSLLLSESLLKNENIYSVLNKNQFLMLENLIDKTVLDPDYNKLESYFLDEDNNIINPFFNLTYNYIEKEYFNAYEEYNNEQKEQVIEDYNLEEYPSDQEIMALYKNYGCNNAIITDNELDFKKLIIRIRNSLAHSNYEIIDNNYLRLYHYNENNQLDFNVKINKILILTIIDELNELAAKLYNPFLDEYYGRNANIQYETKFLTDDKIFSYFQQFNIFTKEQLTEILVEAKNYKGKDFNYRTGDNFEKISIIYDIIFDKIIPVCDYGIILNEIIYYMTKSDASFDNYFYEKFGYYKYFNSVFYRSSAHDTKLLKENKFKILLFSYLNSLFLYNFNSNDEIDYSCIDFSNIIIDEEIKGKYINNKYRIIQNSFAQLSKTEKELFKISESIKRLENQYNRVREKTEFTTKTLPERINNLKNKYNEKHKVYCETKEKTTQDMYNKLFEINDLNDDVNLNHNLSKYIINHLRNALAHGYISFPHKIDYDKLLDTTLLFEDYEKNEKNEKTFSATIKLGDLLSILNDEKVIQTLFNIDQKTK